MIRLALAALLAVTLGAASAPDPARSALRHAISGDLDAGCTGAELATIVDGAGLTTIGHVGGQRVVLANLQGACICGNVNCPYLVLQVNPALPTASRVLLSTYAYEVAPVGNARPLPNLRELAHDSALVSDETTDAFRTGRYISAAVYRVRGDTGQRKANEVPVHFAAGASSAPLTGRISAGWYDNYVFSAGKSQRLTISGVHGPTDITFGIVAHRGTGTAIDLTPGVPAVLPLSGDYTLHVDTGSQDDQAYRATVTIR